MFRVNPVNIYFNSEKTDVITKKLYHGEELTLPTYHDFAEHTPYGKYPTGFDVNGKHYYPGSKIIVPKCESLEINATYENSLHEEYGELVLFENFEALADGTEIYNPVSGINNPIGFSYVKKPFSKASN